MDSSFPALADILETSRRLKIGRWIIIGLINFFFLLESARDPQLSDFASNSLLIISAFFGITLYRIWVNTKSLNKDQKIQTILFADTSWYIVNILVVAIDSFSSLLYFKSNSAFTIIFGTIALISSILLYRNYKSTKED